MGLVNRLAAPGTALDGGGGLAAELAALPQICLRSDRRSAIEQWGLGEEDAAVVNEARLGRPSSASGETAGRGRALRRRRAAAGRRCERQPGALRPTRPRLRRGAAPGAGGPEVPPPGAPAVAAFDFDGTLTSGGRHVSASWSPWAAGGRCRRAGRHRPPTGRAALPAARRPTAPKRRCSSGSSPVCRPPRSTGRAAHFAARTLAAAHPARGPGAPRVAPRQGHRVVIVSASPECYVGPAARSSGWTRSGHPVAVTSTGT